MRGWIEMHTRARLCTRKQKSNLLTCFFSFYLFALQEILFIFFSVSSSISWPRCYLPFRLECVCVSYLVCSASAYTVHVKSALVCSSHVGTDFIIYLILIKLASLECTGEREREMRHVYQTSAHSVAPHTHKRTHIGIGGAFRFCGKKHCMRTKIENCRRQRASEQHNIGTQMRAKRMPNETGRGKRNEGSDAPAAAEK